MKQIVLITGANGMVAKSLAEKLSDHYDIRFLSRSKSNGNQFEWNVDSNYIDPRALDNVNHVIHLAGAGIADKRWTEDRKQLILTSRTKSAQLILDALLKRQQIIDSFISISGTGYYGGYTKDETFDEESEPGNDYLGSVCVAWENCAKQFEIEKVARKVAIVRAGVVLAKNDGALTKIAAPIKYGIGSLLGSGKQFMPWIHLEDLNNIFKFILENDSVQGIYNAVAPDHVTNKVFTQTLAKQLKRPLFLPKVPKFLLKLILGEMSVVVLEGSRVSSKKIQDAGFNFGYGTLKEALSNLYPLK